MHGLLVVKFYYILHMCSKITLEYFDVSVWTRSFWKKLESARYILKCIWINVDVDPVPSSQKFSNVKVVECVSLAAVTLVQLEDCRMLLKLMFTYRWIPNSLY